MCGKGLIWGADEALYHQKAKALNKYALYINDKPHPWSDIVGDLPTMNTKWDFVVLGPEAPDVLHRIPKMLHEQGHIIWWNTKPCELRGFYKKSSHTHNGLVVEVLKRGQPKPTPTKRACVCRYGALGDFIIMTPLLKALKQDGYNVTVNITPYAAELAKHNPNIDNIILQERDIIPNPWLGDYWKHWESRYDRYINLSESLEGSLLKVEGRPDFYTPTSQRHNECNINYYDHTMKLGGYPELVGQRGELYLTKQEEQDALNILTPNKFNIVWALNGSSHHKIYPLMQPVLEEFLATRPDARAILIGDSRAKQLEFDHPQVLSLCDEIPLRTSIALIKNASLVIGPESFATNAAGCWDVPKLVFLSHSSEENLTKYWTNTTPLIPTSPCYGTSGCHQLHYSLESCPVTELYEADTNTVVARVPACTVSIQPQQVLDTLSTLYSKYHKNML